MKSKAARRRAQKVATEAWRRRNPEKVKATRRLWWKRFYAKAENRELHIARVTKDYHRVKNTKKYKRARDKRRLLYTYGLTLDQVIALYKKQRGKCAICKKTRKKLNIDHCHSSKKVRGLLCQKCNVGLGLFSDCVKNLSSAIKYLRRQRKNED